MAPAHQCCLKNGQFLLENYLLQQFHTNPAQQGRKILTTLLGSQSVSVEWTFFAPCHHKHQRNIVAESELSKITNITEQPNSSLEHKCLESNSINKLTMQLS